MRLTHIRLINLHAWLDLLSFRLHLLQLPFLVKYAKLSSSGKTVGMVPNDLIYLSFVNEKKTNIKLVNGN